MIIERGKDTAKLPSGEQDSQDVGVIYDYGYNHNRLIHEDEEWDTDGMGENGEKDDDWESMYV